MPATPGTYQTGHRFEGRAIGAAADGDSPVVSAGLTLVEDDGKSWNALLRWAEINQDSQGEGNNVFHSVAVEETERMGLQVSHRRELRYNGLNLGYLALGAGVEQTDNNVTGDDSTDFQAFAQWTWDLSGL